MKALTEKQPWASLIVEGLKISDVVLFKDIENRTWECPKKYIGKRVLIHASAKSWSWGNVVTYLNNWMPDIYKYIPLTRNWLENLPTGKIIGSVEIVDCVINHPSVWAEKTNTFLKSDIQFNTIYNWVLTNPILFDKPIPCKGKLSFWDFDETLIKEKYE